MPSLELSTKGLTSFDTEADVRSNVKPVVLSCRWMAAFLSVVSRELPLSHAAIHEELVLLRLIWPPLAQLLQLEHMIFAFMVLPSTPDPAKTVSFAAVLLVSSTGIV